MAAIGKSGTYMEIDEWHDKVAIKAPDDERPMNRAQRRAAASAERRGEKKTGPERRGRENGRSKYG